MIRVATIIFKSTMDKQVEINMIKNIFNFLRKYPENCSNIKYNQILIHFKYNNTPLMNYLVLYYQLNIYIYLYIICDAQVHECIIFKANRF